jgi:hypothetical protein
MNKYLREVILSIMTISSLTFLSCGDKDDPLPKFVENLPSAERVKSTSAYIPVYDKGTIELRYGRNENLDTCWVEYYSAYLPKDSCGWLITCLEPDLTYYYTMIYHQGNERILSKQTGSFTTKGVSIEFIEPTTISMGYEERKVLRVKTHGVEKWDVPANLQVIICCKRDGYDYPSYYGLATNVGDGIWQGEWRPSEGEHFQALIKCRRSERTVAETPIFTFSNGMLVEE